MPTSFLPRSTSMICSARSLGSANSSLAKRWSSSSVQPPSADGRVEYPTNDAGYIDGDGRLYLLGRTVRLIKVAGKRVSLDSIEAALLSTMDGFANETDPQVLGIQPVRVDIVTNDADRTFAQFAARHPIPDGADIDSVEGLAILNGMESGTQVPAGMRLKVLVRNNP